MSKEVAITKKQVEDRIFTIRGKQVMTDYYLADLYGVETKRLNERVKRNTNRFPESFMFKVTETEWEHLRSQFATTSNRSQIATSPQKHRSSMPYVFTEQGVAMLSAVLNSEMAVRVSIQIMDAFVKMRQVLLENSMFNHRLDKVERKQLETDQKFEQVFMALESKNAIPAQGVFFNGQVFDAYALASKIIRSAQKSMVLIDNYINEHSLTHLAKKKKGVKVLLLSKTPSTGSGQASKQLQLDVQKANEQYGKFEVKTFARSHDRFLIIDGKEVYHLGASLKDLGKKWFAFSKMQANSVENIMNSISELI